MTQVPGDQPPISEDDGEDIEKVFDGEACEQPEKSVLWIWRGPNSLKTDLAPVDGRYGWVVCFASFVAHFVVLGVQYSFGVLFSEFIDEFNAGRGKTAWVGSVSLGCMFGFGILVGKLSARFGCRIVVQVGACLVGFGLFLSSFAFDLWVLYITHGVITGVGFGLSFAPSIAIIGQWFKKKRALATGLAVAGSGIGTFAVAPLMQLMIDGMGWRWTLRIFSVCAFVSLFLCGTAYAPRLRRDKNVNFLRLIDFSLCCDVALLLMCFSVMFAAFGYFVPFVHLVKYAEDKGISKTNASLLIAILGIASTIGRVVFGWLADFKCVSRPLIYQMSMGATGIFTTLLPLSDEYWFLVCYVIIFGLFAGAFIALMPPVVADLVGMSKLSQALGLMYTIQTLPILLGPPTAGWIFEDTGTYDNSFIVAGCSIVFGNIFLFFIPCVEWSRRFRNRRALDEEKRNLDLAGEGMDIAGDFEMSSTKPKLSPPKQTAPK